MATEHEKLKMKIATGIPNMPTDLTFEYRRAISGEGPHAADWDDKPHRLVYDLCREIERLAAAQSA